MITHSWKFKCRAASVDSVNRIPPPETVQFAEVDDDVTCEDCLALSAEHILLYVLGEKKPEFVWDTPNRQRNPLSKRLFIPGQGYVKTWGVR